MSINWAEKNIEEIELFFSTDRDKGLSANGFRENRRQFGANYIYSGFFNNYNFFSPGISKQIKYDIIKRAVDLFGAIFAMAALLFNLLFEGFRDFNGVFLIAFYSAVLFFFLDSSVKTAARIKYSARPKILVLRQNKRRYIYMENIVPGDILILSAGDVVPADSRIIYANSTAVMGILKNGAHEKFYKTAEFPEPQYSAQYAETGIFPNMLYAGDVILEGSAICVACVTGANTRMVMVFGEKKAAAATAAEFLAFNDNSAMRNAVLKKSKTFTLVAIIMSLGAVLLSLIQRRDIPSVIIMAFAAAVSVFSEQIPLIVDYALTRRLSSLAANGIVIRKNETVDKINAVNFLILNKNQTFGGEFSDVGKIFLDGEISAVSPENMMRIYPVLAFAALCTNAREKLNPSGGVYFEGGAIDIAVRRALRKCGIEMKAVSADFVRIEKIIHNPQNGAYTTLVTPARENKLLMISFGEAENIFELCAWRRTRSGGEVPIDRRESVRLKYAVDDLYKDGALVMAVAVREYGGAARLDFQNGGGDMTLYGLLSFSANKSPGILEDLTYLGKAGITSVMETDSNNISALKAAKKYGIVAPHEQSLGNIALDNQKILAMGEGVFYANAAKYRVLTPLTQKNKLLYLRALKFNRKKTALTVNDPADLRVPDETELTFTSANTETGVLLSKAAVVMRDLSISAVTHVFRSAAVIEKNVKKALSFLNAFFILQYIFIFFPLLTRLPFLISPVQILWSGIMTAFFCTVAIAAGNDSAEWFKYRSDTAGFEKKLNFKMAVCVCTVFLSAAASFFTSIAFTAPDAEISAILGAAIDNYSQSAPDPVFDGAKTSMFITLILALLTSTLFYLKQNHFSDLKVLQNRFFIFALLVNLLLLPLLIFIPTLGAFLGFAAISPPSALFALAYGVLPSAAALAALG